MTGGAGFIGSHLVATLLERGRRVRILDDFSGSRPDVLPRHPDLELLTGDVRDPVALTRAMAGTEVVFHHAALRSISRSVEDPFAYHDVNPTGTMRLLLVASQVGVRRIVFASSSSVYGDQPVLPLYEQLRPQPISPYDASKLIGEHYCANFTRYGLETVSLRYFNVYGPGQDPSSEYAAVLARFILAARRGVPLEIHGDGKQTRDFTYIANLVDANVRAAEAPGVSGQVFNVACGERVSVLDVARALETVLGRRLPIRHKPPRAGDVRDSLADISRARERLGYSPPPLPPEGRSAVAGHAGGPVAVRHKRVATCGTRRRALPRPPRS